MENDLSTPFLLKNKVENKSKSRNKINTNTRKIHLKEIKNMFNSKKYEDIPDYNLNELKLNKEIETTNVLKSNINSNQTSKNSNKVKSKVNTEVNSNSLPKFYNHKQKVKSRNVFIKSQKLFKLENEDCKNQINIKLKSRNKYSNNKENICNLENNNSNEILVINNKPSENFFNLIEKEKKIFNNKNKNLCDQNISDERKITSSFKSLIKHKVNEIIKLKALNSTKNKVHSRNICRKRTEISKSFENKSIVNSDNNSALRVSKLLSKLSEHSNSMNNNNLKTNKQINDMGSGSINNKSKSFSKKSKYILGLELILKNNMPLYRNRNLRNSKYKLLNLAHNILN